MELRVILKNLGDWASDKIAGFVGTWSFIITYTSAMAVWIYLHVIGILHIDSADFIKWNLWLSYFAGIQASILLMAAGRASEKDRKRSEKTLRNTQTQTTQLKDITTQLETFETVLEDLYEEIKAKKELQDGKE